MCEHSPLGDIRAVRAVLLGTILMIIVQSDVLLTNSATTLALLRTGLTFVLLYSVSTYSMASSRRVLRIAQGDQHD